MESRILQYQSKIKHLLEKLTYWNIDVDIEVQLAKLLQSFQENPDVLSFSLFSEWLSKAVATWWDTETPPPGSVLSFGLNLGSKLMDNEQHFCFFLKNDTISKLLKLLQVADADLLLSTQLNYIKLLISFLNHRSGLEWIIFHDIWQGMFHISLTNQSLLVIEESGNFIAKFVENIVEYDENYCHNIIKHLVMPLNERTSAHSNDSMQFQNLESGLKLLGNILEYFLEGFQRRGDFRVLNIFLINLSLESEIISLSSIYSNKHIAFYIYRIIFILNFLELYGNIVNNTINPQDTQKTLHKIKNRFLSIVSISHYTDSLLFCNFGHLYWTSLSSKISKNDIDSFSNQFVILEIQPHFAFIIKNCHGINKTVSEYNHFVDIFIQKIVKMCDQETMRCLFSWRDLLPEDPNLLDLCITSLTNVRKSLNFFSKEHALLFFQGLFYTIRSTVDDLKKSLKLVDCIEREYGFLIFETFLLLIEKYKFAWKDCHEIVHLLEICFVFLNVFTWQPKIVVQALNVMNILISGYMTPDLALLVDLTNDSTIALLSPFLLKKLSDNDDHVREASLKIICSIAQISKKFSSTQEILMDSKFLNLVVEISDLDSESFVRAVATRCLHEMIWVQILDVELLLQKMETVLLNEPHAIVRVEAVRFITTAYEHQKIQKELLQKIYVAMALSLTTDLDSKVKLQILVFWDKVIDNLLQNEGMIDGEFPEMTFSQQQKKIIALTDLEIKKRLKKVIDNLGSINCLDALVSVVKYDCDEEVSELGLKLIQKLLKLLNEYNVCDSTSRQTEVCDYDEMITTNFCWKKSESKKNEVGQKAIIMSSEFLLYTQEDYDRWIENRKYSLRGLEDLEYLFDEITKIIEKRL